ncbi:MAG: hypothetical protein CMH30_01535 [Micavibrio sp.]|nr:hypothetical protein [Micavibrio sp.]|tara:strand:+ start:3548 stop:4420 length:873 start_codon:yes stop_codon:yes gene_type:complete
MLDGYSYIAYKYLYMRFSAEFFCPHTADEKRELLKLTESLSTYNPSFFSITFSTKTQEFDSSLKLAQTIQNHTDTPVALHMSCIGTPKDILKQRLDKALNAEIQHIVALRGDWPRSREDKPPQGNEYCHYASDFVALIKSHAPAIKISVGAYPEKHKQAETLGQDIQHLKQKLDQGADQAITQFYFDQLYFDDFVKKTAQAGITKPIIAGLMAISDFELISRFAHGAEAKIPETITRRFADLSSEKMIEEGTIFLQEQIITAQKSGVEEIHLYPMNKPNPILKALDHFFA